MRKGIERSSIFRKKLNFVYNVFLKIPSTKNPLTFQFTKDTDRKRNKELGRKKTIKESQSEFGGALLISCERIIQTIILLQIPVNLPDN